VIGTLAWSLLVIGLWINVRTLPARIVAAVGVIGLALTPAVYTWDFAILSEALSVGLGVMALGLFAIWTRTGSRVAAAALGVVGVWWTFTRPDVLPYIVVLAVAVLGLAVRRQDRRLTAVLVTGALLLGAGWSAATLSRTDDSFRNWGLHLGLSESTFVYRLRLEVYPDDQVLEVYTERFGLPGGPEAAEVAKQEDWAIERFVQAYESCPGLVAWASKEKSTVAVRYMLADPVHFRPAHDGRHGRDARRCRLRRAGHGAATYSGEALLPVARPGIARAPGGVPARRRGAAGDAGVPTANLARRGRHDAGRGQWYQRDRREPLLVWRIRSLRHSGGRSDADRSDRHGGSGRRRLPHPPEPYDRRRCPPFLAGATRGRRHVARR